MAGDQPGCQIVGFSDTTGIFLIPLLPILWTASRAPGRALLLELAAANAAGAILFSLWVLIWHDSFTRAGATFVLAVAAALGVLAVAEMLAAPRAG